ncbi:MAG: hypothetical protein WBD47_20565, partial [Phormidesmis sp.]
MSALTFEILSAEITQALSTQSDTPPETTARCNLGRDKVMVLVEYPLDSAKAEPRASETLDWLEQHLRHQFDTTGLPEEAADLADSGEEVAVHLFLKHLSETKPFTMRSFVWKVDDSFDDIFGQAVSPAQANSTMAAVDDSTPVFEDPAGTDWSDEEDAIFVQDPAFREREENEPIPSELDEEPLQLDLESDSELEYEIGPDSQLLSGLVAALAPESITPESLTPDSIPPDAAADAIADLGIDEENILLDLDLPETGVLETDAIETGVIETGVIEADVETSETDLEIEATTTDAITEGPADSDLSTADLSRNSTDLIDDPSTDFFELETTTSDSAEGGTLTDPEADLFDLILPEATDNALYGGSADSDSEQSMTVSSPLDELDVDESDADMDLDLDIDIDAGEDEAARYALDINDEVDTNVGTASIAAGAAEPGSIESGATDSEAIESKAIEPARETSSATDLEADLDAYSY